MKHTYHTYRQGLITLAFLISDYLAASLGAEGAYLLRKYVFTVHNYSFTVNSLYLWVIIPAFAIIMLAVWRTYQIDRPYWQKVRDIIGSSTVATGLAIIFIYFGHIAGSTSRLFIFMTWLFMTGFLLVFRFGLERYLLARGFFSVPYLLVGAGKTAQLYLQALKANPFAHHHIIGCLDDNAEAPAISEEVPCLGGFLDAEEVIRETKVNHVLVCAPGLAADELVPLINRLEILVKNVRFVPDLLGVPANNLSIADGSGRNMLVLNVKNNLARYYYRWIKRCFDIIVILVCSPLLLLGCLCIALMVRLDSKGPVFFAHQRVGRYGRSFACYKFRSMVVDSKERLEAYLATHPEAEAEWNREFKLKEDPRITRIGKFLRKTSLDELPQLWNVLKGDMSLVGPRPIVAEEVPKYGIYIDDYYLVRPGITGIWQVNGRSNTTYEERVQMDSWYVHNWSVWIDVVYLIKTVLVVLKREGAY